nr:unnamed protein product [Callosobruchus analis]
MAAMECSELQMEDFSFGNDLIEINRDSSSFCEQYNENLSEKHVVASEMFEESEKSTDPQDNTNALPSDEEEYDIAVAMVEEFDSIDPSYVPDDDESSSSDGNDSAYQEEKENETKKPFRYSYSYRKSQVRGGNALRSCDEKLQRLLFKSTLRIHFRKCAKGVSKNHRSTMIISRRVMGRIHEKAIKKVRHELFPPLREDQVVRAIRYDELVIIYANKMVLKYKTHDTLK